MATFRCNRDLRHRYSDDCDSQLVAISIEWSDGRPYHDQPGYHGIDGPFLDALDVASVRMWVAAAAVMPLSLLLVGFDLGDVTSQGYMVLLYAAFIGTFSGMMLAFYNIQRFGATASAMTSYVIPIVAGIAGVLLLGETITTFMAIGMALIIAGIALINQRSQPARGVEV